MTSDETSRTCDDAATLAELARLDRLTAPAAADVGPLAAEEQELRDAWLSLGELLTAVDAQAEPLPAFAPNKPTRTGAFQLWAAALAACLLLAAAVGAWRMANPPEVVLHPTAEPPAAVEPVVADVGRDSLAAAEDSASAGNPTNEPTPELSTWDDDFDERLAALQSGVDSLAADRRTQLDWALDTLGERISDFDGLFADDL